MEEKKTKKQKEKNPKGDIYIEENDRTHLVFRNSKSMGDFSINEMHIEVSSTTPQEAFDLFRFLLSEMKGLEQKK